MSRFLFSCLILGVVLQCAAQDNQESQNTAVISGTVVDSITGQPLPGAQVFARNLPGPGRERFPRPTSANADANGRFSFSQLSPGRYIVRATHPGYLNRFGRGARSGARMIPLAAGERVGDVTVRLTPGGSISGHVTDEQGRAVSGASLDVLTYAYSGARRQLHEVSSANSGKEGEYRITNLPPGSYLLRASPRETQVKPGTSTAYVPLYYPNAVEQGRAGSLDLHPGEELAGIDINFARVRTVKIRGHVIDQRTSLPGKAMQVVLLSDAGATPFHPGESTTDNKGAFTFTGVPPGKFLIVAQSTGLSSASSLWGREAIEVDDANIDDLKVIVGPGAEVSGHIRVEGHKLPDLTKIAAILEPQDGAAIASLMPEVDPATVTSDGRFAFRDVPEGTYRLSFNPIPPGFYLRSDGSPDSMTGLTITRGHGVPSLDMVLAPATASIQGVVSNENQPAPLATVVLVPDAAHQGDAAYYRTATADRAGHFVIHDIPEGEYSLFAWDQVEKDAYLDPDFLRQFEDRGRPIHVNEGDHDDVQLSLIFSDADTTQ